MKTIIDVRTPGEFLNGNVNGSINIPLSTLSEKLNELKAIKQPFIVCCASGGRSAQAKAYLSSQGINCEDGGSWLNLRN
jgi:rhodanese-related sulfurtransferase